MKIMWLDVVFPDQPEEHSIFTVVAEDEATARKEVTDSIKDATQAFTVTVVKQVSIEHPPIAVNVVTNLTDRFKYLQPEGTTNGKTS